MFTLLLVLCGIIALTSAVDTCASIGLKSNFTYIDSSVDYQPRYVKTSSVVFVITQGKTLYRSKDDGFSWQLENLPVTAGGQVAKVEDLFFSYDTSKVIMLGSVDDTDVIWKSKDSGVTFSVEENKHQLVWFVAHPSISASFIAFSYAPPHPTTFLSVDMDNWVQVASTSFATRFACFKPTGGNPDSPGCAELNAIVYEEYDSTGVEWQQVTPKLVVHRFDKASSGVLTDDKRTLLERCDGLAAVKMPWYDTEAVEVLFSSEVRDAEVKSTDQQRVRYSYDHGITWHIALFPFGTQRHEFVFVTTEKDVLFAAVRDNSLSDDVNHGTLYVSGTNHLNEPAEFSESLKYVRFTGRRFWETSAFAGRLDIERQAEMDGVLLANRYRTAPNGSPDLSCVQTVFTADMGARWEFLRYDCEIAVCKKNLHVRLGLDGQPTAYSPQHAVGVWLAQGNVGECLSDDPSDLQTFVSRDAGFSWRLMSEERQIYEVSNHGALIVGAPTEHSTSLLTFTLDEGDTFQECSFMPSNKEIVVNNILTSDFNARGFVLEGRESDAADSRGVLVHFSFDDVHTRECADDDYELWTLDMCLLGEEVLWRRRKPTSMCHNPEEHEATKEEGSCECTAQDFECDFCYERDISDGDGLKCVVAPGTHCGAFTANPDLFCASGVTTYRKSKGFRKTPNNKCHGGVSDELDGVIEECPTGDTSSSPVATIFFVVLAFGILAIVAAAVFVYMKRKKAAHSYASFEDE